MSQTLTTIRERYKNDRQRARERGDVARALDITEQIVAMNRLADEARQAAALSATYFGRGSLTADELARYMRGGV